MRTTMLAGLALALPAEALACGGFFCDNAAPVDQSGERILFVVDEEAGKVDVHVQITYEGPSEEFAWLLPAPAEPELGVSNDDVIDRLGGLSDPLFNLTTETLGDCASGRGFTLSGAAEDSADFDSGSNGGVTVEELTVGPYDVQKIQGSDVAVLITWLTDNGYDLPDDAEERLAPYVADGGWFVGLKLSKDSDAGDIVPLRMAYAGTEPVIPLVLTGVAAIDDMPLQPFVVGPHRAVPDNYLHVLPNLLLVDWLQAGVNWRDLVGRAADAAGGQAFATDMATEAPALGALFAPEGFDTLAGRVQAATTVDDLMSFAWFPNTFGPVDTSGYTQPGTLPITRGTLPFIRAATTLPQGVSADDFDQCPQCYGGAAVDGAALWTALEEGWATPLSDVRDALRDAGWFTRLTSSLSPDEMDADPRFVFNPDLGEVDRNRNATLQVDCRGGKTFGNAPRTLVLEDGRELPLPSTDEWFTIGATWESWTAELAQWPAEEIQQTARSGAPSTLQDFSAEIDATLAGISAGCGGCNTGGRGGVALGLGALLLAGLRRRR
jgi:hypothetical protein